MLENCVFYILRMYEFLHRVGQTRSFSDIGSMSGLPESGHGGPTDGQERRKATRQAPDNPRPRKTGSVRLWRPLADRVAPNTVLRISNGPFEASAA